MFDNETKKNLTEYGIIVAAPPSEAYIPHGFENAFHIVNGNHSKVLEAIKLAIIDVNIDRGKYAELYKKEKELKAQIVYDSYPGMFQTLYHLIGKGKWTEEGGKTFPPNEKDLFLWFDLKEPTKYYANFEIAPNMQYQETIKFKTGKEKEITKTFYPTKNVDARKSHFGF